MRVFFTNLGCKLNQAEVEKLAREFRAAGHRWVASLEDADLHVINTCTVTHLAARDSRKVARRGGRVQPGVRTVLTGCYATDAQEEAGKLLGVDLVVPNHEKSRLLERVHQAFPQNRPSPEEASPLPVPFVPLPFGHTRAAVKVEDGCNMRCAFCIIPKTRGRQHSRPMAEVVTEVQELVRSGVLEVVITGVQISSYRTAGGQGLSGLVALLLDETQVARLRLTSIAPWEFDLNLLDLWRNPRLCRHVHLSLQSGCDATLRRMRRPYTARRYADLVARIRDSVPGVAITTDVIVGFPGESEEEFRASLDTVERLGFARVHAFPFSPRNGTEAATLPHQVPVATRKRRLALLLDVARRGERRFFEEHLGTTANVLWEEKKGDLWQGMTDNYIRVTSASPATGGQDLRNTLSETRLVALGRAGMVGERLS